MNSTNSISDPQLALFPAASPPPLRDALPLLERPRPNAPRSVLGYLHEDCTRIFALLADGAWHDADEIARACRTRAWSSRLRDLRQCMVTKDGAAWRVFIDTRPPNQRGRAWEYRAALIPAGAEGNTKGGQAK
jgi:hypothetical protein